MYIGNGNSESECGSLHVFILNESLYLLKYIGSFRLELLWVALDHGDECLECVEVDGAHGLVEEVEHAGNEESQVGDLNGLGVAGNLGQSLERCVPCHVVQQAVIVDLYDFVHLRLGQVLVAHGDEVSHRDDRTLLDLLVYICCL